MTVQQQNFERLQQLLPNLRTLPPAMKLKAPGFMDLNVDVLAKRGQKLVIALSHYYKHSSGDMIPDPDMTMAVYFANSTVEALSYQDCFGYRRAYREDMSVESPAIQQELNRFLAFWLRNLLSQGHSA
ncbi:DUF1249 domain-containing protein [Chromobacterium paludis]|uniref:DUF1249 domain-containing protein n=1 Tax=Chromobacterium paludis TaxID=2605945 RepID=A0A5C1DHJ9_9NEIS|nr:DUF1249 domain-containing protein [Chromobacterium paludis]QEL56033.1 DUF1249 domain-containing protein [Chromobacterium paludis]